MKKKQRQKRYRASIATMPLLDYFAGQALQGMCSSKGWRIGVGGSMRQVDTFDDYAEAAYRLAEAMIRARRDDIGEF